MTSETLVPSVLPTTAIDRGVLPTSEVVARVHRVQDVMVRLMKRDVHFGQIPGTPKPTLYKPGAELLLMTFRIAASPERIEDLSTPDEVRYRVTVRGTNQVSGEIVGEMVGECTSSEEKYRWRKPVCDEEWQETDPGHRREKWMKGASGPYKTKQVRTSPPDVANTILKMAVKRGLIALTLVALGASDIFTQDLDDLAQELRESIVGDDAPGRATPAAPVRRASARGEKTPTATSGTGRVAGPARVTDVRIFGREKNNYALTLEGDPQEYTTKDAMLAAELEQFKGTDHQVRVVYENRDWNGKTYHNLHSFTIADTADVPADVPADDSPF